MTIPNPDTPIERAARAMVLSFEATFTEHALIDPQTWDDLSEAERDRMRAAFRAGLLALREPDEATIAAAVVPLYDALGPQEPRKTFGDAVSQIFTAAIDHLIASGEQ